MEGRRGLAALGVGGVLAMLLSGGDAPPENAPRREAAVREVRRASADCLPPHRGLGIRAGMTRKEVYRHLGWEALLDEPGGWMGKERRAEICGMPCAVSYIFENNSTGNAEEAFLRYVLYTFDGSRSTREWFEAFSRLATGLDQSLDLTRVEEVHPSWTDARPDPATGQWEAGTIADFERGVVFPQVRWNGPEGVEAVVLDLGPPSPGSIPERPDFLGYSTPLLQLSFYFDLPDEYYERLHQIELEQLKYE